jgi:hypothetical protein
LDTSVVARVPGIFRERRRRRRRLPQRRRGTEGKRSRRRKRRSFRGGLHGFQDYLDLEAKIVSIRVIG